MSTFHEIVQEQKAHGDAFVLLVLRWVQKANFKALGKLEGDKYEKTLTKTKKEKKQREDGGECYSVSWKKKDHRQDFPCFGIS